jgi:hypothetical protein
MSNVKRHQFEIEIKGGKPNDYGMINNPPIVACGKNRKDVLKQFHFPKKVKVTKVTNVGKC